MSKVVRFKPPHVKIIFRNGDPELNERNLTYEKYEKLVEKNPNYRELFIVEDFSDHERKVIEKKK